jgi:hypothetical protein
MLHQRRSGRHGLIALRRHPLNGAGHAAGNLGDLGL